MRQKNQTFVAVAEVMVGEKRVVVVSPVTLREPFLIPVFEQRAPVVFRVHVFAFWTFWMCQQPRPVAVAVVVVDAADVAGVVDAASVVAAVGAPTRKGTSGVAHGLDSGRS